MAKKLMPVGDRCLVKEDEVETDIDAFTKRTGITIVEYENSKHLEKPTTGKVVAVGNGPLINDCVKVGDTVFYAKYAGKYTVVEGVQYRNLMVGEITDVLRDDDEATAQAEAPQSECKHPGSE